MAADQRGVVGGATRLLQAMVDVISSSGWLNPALAAMEMSQMVTQAMWQRDPVLMQLPHVTRERAEACTAQGVETVFDLMEMEDDARRELLQMSEPQLEDVARWCNRYPDISVNHQVADTDDIRAGEPVSLTVALEREAEGELRPVDAPRYPGRKDENWWLVVGDTSANTLLAIKRVTLQRKAKVKLDFVAPKAVGAQTLTLFFMCDSYMGCDQEFELELDVKEGAASDAEEPMEAAEAGEEQPQQMDQD